MSKSNGLFSDIVSHIPAITTHPIDPSAVLVSVILQLLADTAVTTTKKTFFPQIITPHSLWTTILWRPIQENVHMFKI